MTCIVGIIDEENERVLLGGDSAGVAGLDMTEVSNPKVFKVGDFIMGYTSSFRMGLLLQYGFTPPAVNKKDREDILKYLNTKFINKVKDLFKKNGYSEVRANVEEGGTFLIGYKDRLFCVQCDYSVLESNSLYNSVGCGERYALGALEALHVYDIPAEEKLITSLKAAEKLSAGVISPFKTVST